MNRLVLIGNGFDMAHGLKTSYMDFINWYWEQRLNALLTELRSISKDCLCCLEIVNKNNLSWSSFLQYSSCRDSLTRNWKYPPSEIISFFKENTGDFSVRSSIFFETILQSIKTKGWVDIENDYYQLLKKCTEDAYCGYSIKELNEQLTFLREKLIEYLCTVRTNQPVKNDLHNAMIDFFDPMDFSTEGRKKALDNIGLGIKSFEEVEHNYNERNKLLPEHIMLLSFNYTATAKMYNHEKIKHNYIHGELEQPKNIIFGYGDELDKDYQGILDRNNNELLKNVKSVKYLETRHYKDMLEFLMSAPYQVLVMGHSCGNSDRTLLNTVFEHENCVSIKPFYHKWPDGRDNYLDIVQNISRNFNFTNMRLFRDRVVNKEQCKTI